jgi:hypothetical protein
MTHSITSIEFLDLIAALCGLHSDRKLALFVKYHRRFLGFVRIDRHISTIIDESRLHDGVLVMRRYKGERRLVVACGNGPLLFDDTDDLPMCSDEFFMDYREDHLHIGEYTINILLGMNPSMIGSFGQTDLRRLLPQECFEEIEFEGGGCREEKWTVSNLRWLLKEGGRVLLSGGKGHDKKQETWIYNTLVKKDGQLYTEREGPNLPPKGTLIDVGGSSFTDAWGIARRECETIDDVFDSAAALFDNSNFFQCALAKAWSRYILSTDRSDSGHVSQSEGRRGLHSRQCRHVSSSCRVENSDSQIRPSRRRRGPQQTPL